MSRDGFKFTKQLHTDKTNAWFYKIYLGEISPIIRERKDIDWDKYRADKTLRMPAGERFIIKYIPTVKIGGHISRILSTSISKEDAAQAMLDFHRNNFNDS